MFCRQRLYLIVRKISFLVYKLDFPEDFRIYPMIFIVYLLCYRVYDDPFKRILVLPGFIEYGAETNTSGDDARDGKHWELERVVDYVIRRGKTYYLVR